MRVLQVLGTTDADDDADASLDLHRGLAHLGVEVRTLALAPGRTAGFQTEIPTMGPSVRSLAAVTQLRREQRWADVVVLRGEAPVAAAGWLPARGAPPTVLQLGCDAWDGKGAGVPTRVRRLAQRGIRVVVPHRSARWVGPMLGITSDEVEVIACGVDVGGVVPSDGSARRSAARRVLGVPEEARVALVLGDDEAALDAAAEAGGLGMVVLSERAFGIGGRSDDELVTFGAEGDHVDTGARRELVASASDLVIAPGVACDISPRLLRAAGVGLAVVATGGEAMSELVDDTTGWLSIGEAASVDDAELRRRGRGAAARVAERFGLGDVSRRWVSLLASVRGSGPVPSASPERP